MAHKANSTLDNTDPGLEEEVLAPLPEGEDLIASVNSSEDLTGEDLLVDDDDDLGEDVKQDDHSFGKPWKNVYYKRHPDHNWNKQKIGLIKLKNKSDPWVVKGDLCKALVNDGLYYARVYTLIDSENDLLFMPVKVARNGETLDSWNTSAHQLQDT